MYNCKILPKKDTQRVWIQFCPEVCATKNLLSRVRSGKAHRKGEKMERKARYHWNPTPAQDVRRKGLLR